MAGRMSCPSRVCVAFSRWLFMIAFFLLPSQSGAFPVYGMARYSQLTRVWILPAGMASITVPAGVSPLAALRLVYASAYRSFER